MRKILKKYWQEHLIEFTRVVLIDELKFIENKQKFKTLWKGRWIWFCKRKLFCWNQRAEAGRHVIGKIFIEILNDKVFSFSNFFHIFKKTLFIIDWNYCICEKLLILLISGGGWFLFAVHIAMETFVPRVFQWLKAHEFRTFRKFLRFRFALLNWYKKW